MARNFSLHSHYCAPELYDAGWDAYRKKLKFFLFWQHVKTKLVSTSGEGRAILLNWFTAFRYNHKPDSERRRQLDALLEHRLSYWVVQSKQPGVYRQPSKLPSSQAACLLSLRASDMPQVLSRWLNPLCFVGTVPGPHLSAKSGLSKENDSCRGCSNCLTLHNHMVVPKPTSQPHSAVTIDVTL